MTTTDKYEAEGSFNSKIPRHNILFTLFYSNITEFARKLQLMLDEVTHKTTIQNMYKLGWKAQLFKSNDVSMLGYGRGVSKNRVRVDLP